MINIKSIFTSTVLLFLLFIRPAQANTKQSKSMNEKDNANISIIEQPVNKLDLTPGSKATLEIKFQGSDKININWYKKTFDSVSKLKTQEDLHINKDAKSSKLIISNFNKEDEAYYFAKLSLHESKQSIKSNETGLRLNKKERDMVVKEESFQNSFQILKDENIPPIVVDKEDEKVVQIASESFSKDIKRVSETKPKIYNKIPEDKNRIIITGSATKSKYIRKLIQKDKFDSYHIEHGQRESFIISVVEEPFQGIDQALVIAGSDPRGTAFGIYELSKKMGVSPWVWWADAAVEQKQSLFISRGNYEFGPPSVKHRGIFINDEDWSLRPWAARNYEKELGNIGPKTYAQVFELLLRLKANHIWPAMHKETLPFYKHPENQKVADKYSIIVGSSHTEVMLYNNAEEWDREEDGPWDYTQNSKRMKEVWRQRVKQTAYSTNAYQVGIRGVHDTGMQGVSSYEEGADLVTKIIQDQREILVNNINKPIEEIPQVFTPYKEVMNYYDAGIDLPEDITIMWVDDNYGHMRRFSNQKEQQRKGGGGIYYHFSYLGTPHPNLWISTTSPTKTWRELKRAYKHNMKDNWILNVGDIKRREWPMELGLQLGWNIEKWDNKNIKEYFEKVAGRDISSEYAQTIGEIMWEFHQLSSQRKPELMGFSQHWNGSEPIQNPDFSLLNYGDEVQKRINQHEKLVQKAEKVYSKLNSEQKVPFFELVLYPVRGASNLNKKILHTYKNKFYAEQNRYEANYHAKKANQAFDQIREDTKFYNKKLKQGKWNFLNDYRPGFYRGSEVFRRPNVTTLQDTQQTEINVAIEGTKSPLSKLDQKLQINKKNKIDLSIEEAKIDGDSLILGEDQNGSFAMLETKNAEQLQFPNDEKAFFDFNIADGQEGKYTLYANVTHPDEESNSWYVQVDDREKIIWNDEVGIDRFKLGEYELDQGQHTVKFYSRENGAKLRGVELVDQTSNVLPEFNRYTKKKHFIDIFKTGPETVDWNASTNQDWIQLSSKNGKIDKDGDRIWVSIDYDKLPDKSQLMGQIEIKHGDQKYRIYTPVYNQNLNLSKNTHIQDNGVVSINANDYNNKSANQEYSWEIAPGLGKTDTAMILKPISEWYIEDLDNVANTSPSLEYEIFVTKESATDLIVEAIPSFPVIQGKEMRCAVSIDDGSPSWVNFKMGSEWTSIWKNNVSKNVITGRLQTQLRPGHHTLKIWGTDPSINISKIILDMGGLKSSYLGPTSTLVK